MTHWSPTTLPDGTTAWIDEDGHRWRVPELLRAAIRGEEHVCACCGEPTHPQCEFCVTCAAGNE